ncbi:type IV CRISPR-associated protein Csf3 [Rhodoferax antarcticus]|uniref:Putative CRISPR-associated protein n=1 Tax=Rhodoferax antarcticus ANT.BR TaxID=1111071 RepID=A0A1Q8Y9G8_9BURK|nr:type IV CRISPR-associated protein Csf3 [Rhodoferax antarcticus]OLP04587.1 putative CRISPR-associated protein [Rhodoferax antarcticus ANT.BR]
MQALKVTFKLASPIFIDSEYPIHLDALLAYACAQELEKSGEDDCWNKIDGHMASILAKTDGDDWVWKASKLFVKAKSELMFSNQIRKSDPDMYFDDIHTEDQNGVFVTGFMKDGSARKINPETFKIDTASGQQRGYQWLTASRWVKDVTAYAVGDLDAVDYYLREHIRFIGKVGRNGYGRITAIEVSSHDCEDDWMQRVLPLNHPGKSGCQYAPVQACIRAPYWRKTDMVLAKEMV